MKKLIYLIVLALILGLVLTGCLLSNLGQVPTSEQSGITYLTKGSSSGLVGLWHFDEGSNVPKVADSSGNGNEGNVNEATTGVSGKFGNALSFDGVDNYVDCGSSSSLDFTTNVTIEAWVYPKSSASLQMIVDNRNVTASGVQLFYRATTNRIEIQINNKRAADGNVPTNWLNNWHHVLATYTSGVGGSVYIDGIDVSLNVTNRGDIGGTGRTTVIGVRFTKATLFFDGIIDEVRIWDVALDEDAIRQSYELGGAQSSLPCVVQLSHQVLTSGEVVCFTSAFYLERQEIPETDKTVDIYIMSESGDREIGAIGFRRATPAKTDGFLYEFPNLLAPALVSGTYWTAVVNNGIINSKGKTSTSIHLYAELDTDERLGVNAQYLPWD